MTQQHLSPHINAGGAHVHVSPKNPSSTNILVAIASIAFIFLATHTEFAFESRLETYSWAIRAAGLIGLATVTFNQSTIRLLQGRLALPLIVPLHLLAVNATDITRSAFLAAAMASLGLSISWIWVTARKEDANTILKTYQIFHLFGLITAWILYLTSGSFFDLHNLVFPWSESRIGIGWGLPRLAGFQIEPGNYANYVYIVVFMNACLNRKVGTKFNILMVTSTLFSVSTWAYMATTTYIAAVLFEYMLLGHQRTLLGRGLTLCFAVTALATAATLMNASLSETAIGQFLSTRLSGGEESGSTAIKLDTIVYWKLAISDHIFWGSPISQGFCQTCRSPQDIGTIPNMAYYLGVTFTTLITMLCAFGAFRHGGFPLFLTLLPIGFSKAYFFDPLIWLVVGILISYAIRPRGTAE